MIGTMSEQHKSSGGNSGDGRQPTKDKFTELQCSVAEHLNDEFLPRCPQPVATGSVSVR